MTARSDISFFDYKRPWSEYKDRVLDYYLVPYLQKVKQLKKPIVVFDMFAGRGRFKTGERGSPLIIADQLKALHDGGHEVKLVCVEELRDHFTVLQSELASYTFATARQGDSLEFTPDIEEAAKHSTVLLYVDPCNVAQLSLSKLALVYERVRHSSVEVLLVFMARAFLRQAMQILAMEKTDEVGDLKNDPLVQDSEGEDRELWLHALYGGSEVRAYEYVQRARPVLTDVVGGDYWEDVACNSALDFHAKCRALVAKYMVTMQRWFRVTLGVPIYGPAGDRIPKYWLVFGSRYEPAVDLVNDAACRVRRDQEIDYQKAPDSLFQGIPINTKPDPSLAMEAVRERLCALGPTRWDRIRWAVMIRDTGRFLESEINSAIKLLLSSGAVVGTDSRKVSDTAILALRSQR